DGSAGGLTMAEPINLSGAYLATPTTAQFHHTIGAQGALHNVAGDNTISGAITLYGRGSIVGDPGLNTVSVAAGSLTLSGVIQESVAATDIRLTKTGPGTL